MTKSELPTRLQKLLIDAYAKREEGPRARWAYRDLLYVLYAQGWGQRPIADTLGISRQAVFSQLDRCRVVPDDSVLWDMVPPTLNEGSPGMGRVITPMEDDEREYMRKLAEQAGRLVGTMSADHPVRLASEAYTELLVKYLDSGYTVTGLAREIGTVSASSIHNRLRRHGRRGRQDGIALYGRRHPYSRRTEEETAWPTH